MIGASNGKGRDRALSADATISPTYAPDMLKVALDLLIDGETGIWHLANLGSISVEALAEQLGAPGQIASRSTDRLQPFGNGGHQPARLDHANAGFCNVAILAHARRAFDFGERRRVKP